MKERRAEGVRRRSDLLDSRQADRRGDVMRGSRNLRRRRNELTMDATGVDASGGFRTRSTSAPAETDAAPMNLSPRSPAAIVALFTLALLSASSSRTTAAAASFVPSNSHRTRPSRRSPSFRWQSPRRMPLAAGSLMASVAAADDVECGESQSFESSSTATMTETIATTATLPELFPDFASVLSSQGYVTPTPIQRSSALRAKGGENLLLIAPTGSGKTFAYLLPALSRVRALEEQERRQQEMWGEDEREEQMTRVGGDVTPKKTVLIVAPTRELAAQLARDATALLQEFREDEEEDDDVFPTVVLAARGVPPPSPLELARATVLVGTPDEICAVLTRVPGGREFVGGRRLAAVVLDEVDALLPMAPKTLRTALDTGGERGGGNDRKMSEQKRKKRAAMRRGYEFRVDESKGGGGRKGAAKSSSAVLAPTERVLRLAASGRGFVEGGVPPPQVFAGSATASRRTRDRLNTALRGAATDGWSGASADEIWGGGVRVCRPDEPGAGVRGGGTDADAGGEEENEIGGEGIADALGLTTAEETESRHTIRAVTVPSAVSHRYVSLAGDAASDADAVMDAVAAVARELRAESSLVFICGEFGREIVKEKKRELPELTQKTSKARREAERRRVFAQRRREAESSHGKKGKSGPEPLSVRRACSMLQSSGIDARPMHVVLGLERNAASDANEEGIPPVLVTFEGTARGLHFDGVDVVFVVGRPASAASYLHLAGRVGRSVASTSDGDGGEGGERDSCSDVAVRPGTIVSFCSKGRVTELKKWTDQVGGTAIDEIVL